VVAGGHLSPIFGIDAGFQEYTTMSDFSTFQETAPFAIERLRTLAPELREDDRPWLFLVHGYDTHSPYFKQGPLHRMMSPDYAGPMLDHIDDPLFYERVYQGVYYPDFEPPQLVSSDGAHFLDVAMFASLQAHAAEPTSRREALTPADLAFLAGTYDAAVAHADYQVGVLLEELALLGMDQRTHIVVFSDHGEDLQEHGYYNHRQALIDVNLHVPLILAGPDMAPARIDTPVAIGDIHPTVLQIGGLAPKPDPAGRPTPDLRAAPDPHRVVYAESLLGEISARDARGRLTMARDALQPPEVPAAAPAGASWTTAEGSAWPPPTDLYLALRATADSR
jgi:arylsulfatase A-like enzyme